MTPEQVRKDREAGTQGPWRVEYDCGVTKLYMGSDCVMGDAHYYPWTPENLTDWERIARVPDLEAFYLLHHDAPSRIGALEARLEVCRRALYNLSQIGVYGRDTRQREPNREIWQTRQLAEVRSTARTALSNIEDKAE